MIQNQFFLQFFQTNTTVCLIIDVFCKSCKHEPEIVLKNQNSYQNQNKNIFYIHVYKSYKTRKSTLLCIGNFKEIVDLSSVHLAVLSVGNFD